jgi:hypothetical protein
MDKIEAHLGKNSAEVWAAAADAGTSNQVSALFLFGRPFVTNRLQRVVFSFDGTTTSGFVDSSLVRALETAVSCGATVSTSRQRSARGVPRRLEPRRDCRLRPRGRTGANHGAPRVRRIE